MRCTVANSHGEIKDRRLAGLTHLHLLNRPAVYDQIRAWTER